MANISYQLYSSRNFPTLPDTLSMLSTLGYDAVEGYGGMMSDDLDAAALKGELDKNKLLMPTCHIGLDQLQSSPKETIALANTLGIKTIYVPAVPPSERVQPAAGWIALGKALEEASKPLLDAGLNMGWHNHAFEFATTDGDDLPLDLILDNAQSLSLELDIAWAVIGGKDAMDSINKYADRLSSVHVKDLAPEGECKDEDGWADAGHGTMDWPALIQRLQELNIEHFILEHDNPSDHQRFASRSFDTVNKLMRKAV